MADCPKIPGDPSVPSEGSGRVVYDELRKLAQRYLGRERADHTLQPTALVHEAWLRLAAQETPAFESESHFVAIAARVMRQVLVDHDRSHRAAKRGGGCLKISLENDITHPDDPSAVDLIDLDEALKRLASFDEQQSRIVELRFFGGLELEEIGRVLEISESTVKRHWRMARAWLYQELATGRETRERH